MPIPLRLASDAPGRERLVRDRLAQAPGLRDGVQQVVDEAFVDGALTLARLEPVARAAHLAACGLVAGDEPLEPVLLGRWQRELGGTGRWRTVARDGAAPAEFVEARVASLCEWLLTDSGRELQPAAAGALVLARLLEIEPFDELGTSVALLATRHVMRRGGGLGPVLGEDDRAALRAAVPAARAFDTRPLAEVLEKGAERALELAITELERRR
jgi:hypothetical protein